VIGEWGLLNKKEAYALRAIWAFYTLFLTQASLVTTAHKKSPIHFVYQASFFCDLRRQEFELFRGFKGNP
jgi:hypothetical protein